MYVFVERMNQLFCAETEDAVRVSKGTFTWGGPTTDNGDEDGANGDVGASTLSK